MTIITWTSSLGSVAELFLIKFLEFNMTGGLKFSHDSISRKFHIGSAGDEWRLTLDLTEFSGPTPSSPKIYAELREKFLIAWMPYYNDPSNATIDQ
jgi:hypothetical protein